MTEVNTQQTGPTEELQEAASRLAGGGASGRTKAALALAAVLVGASAAGYVVASLRPAEFRADAARAEEETSETSAEQQPEASRQGAGDVTFYAFEPVVVNLSEERLSRYLRVTVVLAISDGRYKEAVLAVEEKMPLLTNWLIVSLSNKSLAEVRGATSLNRLRREVRDAFNEILDFQGPPPIAEVLFQEFAVQ